MVQTCFTKTSICRRVLSEVTARPSGNVYPCVLVTMSIVHVLQTETLVPLRGVWGFPHNYIFHSQQKNRNDRFQNKSLKWVGWSCLLTFTPPINDDQMTKIDDWEGKKKKREVAPPTYKSKRQTCKTAQIDL